MSDAIKRRNIRYIFAGIFFSVLSGILAGYFLPLFLKEEGFTILSIGIYLSIGLGVGSLFAGPLFSYIQKNIALKTGLFLSLILNFFRSGVLYVFPNIGGSIASESIDTVQGTVYNVSTDVSLQHNVTKNNKRLVSSYHLAFDSSAHVIGILLSILLITYLGFRNSFLIFSLLVIPAFFFYSKINDNIRFKLHHSQKKKMGSIPFNIKAVLLAEVLYWFALSSSFSLVITFLVTDYFGSSIYWVALVFIILQATIVVTSLLTKKFFEKTNLFKSSILGMSLLLISALVILVSSNIYTAVIAFILEGIGAGIWVPSKQALQWKLTKPSLREDVSGYLSGLRGFTNSVGPFAGGLLVTYAGILAPFYMKTAIALICIVVYLLIWKKSASVK